MKTAALALLLLAACGPQWEDRDGWAMEGAAPAHVAEVLQAADELRPCDFRWGGWIAWHPQALDDCRQGHYSMGCYESGIGLARVDVVGGPGEVATNTSLAHELAHYVLDRCEGRPDEGPEHVALTDAINARALVLMEYGGAKGHQ